MSHGFGERRHRGEPEGYRPPVRPVRSPTTSISVCAACARSRCGSTGITDRACGGAGSRSAGSPAHSASGHGKPSAACLWKRDFTALADCSASCSSGASRRVCLLDTLELFGIGASWAASRAWPSPSTAPRCAPRRAGSRGRRCACISASKRSRICWPISNTALPRSPRGARLSAYAGTGRVALAHDEVEVAQIDEDAERLTAMNTDPSVERVDEEQHTAADGEIQNPIGMTLRPAARRRSTAPETHREQALGGESTTTTNRACDETSCR